jgi:hypothetical protein
MAVALCVPTASAQESTGTILGVITDETGAVVPNVAVTITSEDTGLTRTATTGNDGGYVVPLLPVGRYSVEAEASGFHRVVQTGIFLNVNEKARIDIVLRVGSLEDTITVEAEAPMVDTSSSTLGVVIEEKTILDLPLNGRDFTELGLLLPGVLPNPGRSGGGDLGSVGGQRTQSNNFTLDGAANNDLYDSGFVASPPPDAIQEFKILTHNYSAEYGRNSGSVVNVVTKAGTNEVHGSVWEFLRNDALDANDFFSNRAGAEKAPLTQNQFGLSLGGPLRRGKTFAFGFYEGLRERRGVTQNRIVLSPAERIGNFSADNPAPVTCADSGAICDPLNGLPFPNNTIPSARINLAAAALLDFLPLPNSPGNRHIQSPKRVEESDQFSVRIDHHFSDNHTLFGRYYFVDNESNNPLGGSNFSPEGSGSVGRDQTITLRDTYSFSPRLINEFSVAFVRQQEEPTTRSGIDPASLGIQIPVGEPNSLGVPFINLGIFTLGDAGQAFTRRTRNTYQVQEHLTYLRGRHSYKMGFDIRREQLFIIFPNRPNGDFAFSDDATGNARADFLLGIVDRFRQGGGDEVKHFFGTQLGFYWQDDFRVNSRLTLNYGLRYELNLPFYEKFDKMTSFQPGKQSQVFPNAPVGLLYPGDPGVPRATFETDKNNFGPRIGLAWDPWGDGKTSIRAGWALMYDATPGIAAFQNINVPPFNRFVQLDNVSLDDPYFGISPIPQEVDPAVQFPCGQDPTGTDPTQASCLVIGFRPDFVTGYAQHFNLTIQREFLPNFLFEIAYVGSTQTKFSGYLEVNPGLQGADFPTATPANLQQRRIHPAYNLIRPTFSVMNGSYHSLQVNLNKRFSRGYSLLGSWTWSKAIDHSSGVNSSENRPQDAFNLKDVRGRAIYDARHRFVLSYVWELPFFRNATGAVHHALGGWQINGITSVQTGFPLRFRERSDRSLRGLRADRPDIVCDPNDTAPHTVDEWFDTSCIVRLPSLIPGGQRDGTGGRNTIDGPGIRIFDFSLVKNFPIGERHKIQFRSEFFNLFNHPNFGTPGSRTGQSDFGVIQSVLPGAQGRREIQFALKYSF